MPIDILIACDHFGTLTLLWAVLKHCGYSVYRAESGSDALEILAEAKISLLIVDLTSPAMDSVGLCKRVRALKKVSRLPIIMLADARDSDSLVRSRDAGANKLVTKPIFLTDLQSAISELLKSSRR